MSADWAGVLATVAIAVGGGSFALYRWLNQREQENERERQRVNAVYMMPTLFAAEDLQSRLYNLLCRSGLVPLRRHDPSGRYAVETVYLLARYLAWEQLLLRFTYLATDPTIVRLTTKVREDLATDSFGEDPWMIFSPTQLALGQAAIAPDDGSDAANTIFFLKFNRMWNDNQASLGVELGLDRAGEALVKTPDMKSLPPATLRRLAALQTNLVALLVELESRMSRGGDDFSIGLGTGRKTAS